MALPPCRVPSAPSPSLPKTLGTDAEGRGNVASERAARRGSRSPGGEGSCPVPGPGNSPGAWGSPVDNCPAGAGLGL